jgi:hypothetical protein
MAVRTNPYAKMCGAIVKDALQQEVASSKIQYNILGVESSAG